MRISNRCLPSTGLVILIGEGRELIPGKAHVLEFGYPDDADYG